MRLGYDAMRALIVRAEEELREWKAALEGPSSEREQIAEGRLRALLRDIEAVMEEQA